MIDFNDRPAIETADTANSGAAKALAYADQGIPVFPCNPLDKRPLLPAGPGGTGGFHLATTNPLQIKAWWAKWPNAMIGAPTGKASGLVALDVDQDPARGKYGIETLHAIGHPLEELFDHPHTQTAGGGYHVFFAYEPNRPIRNTAGAVGRFLDTRGEGGYVILAGSRTADGRAYTALAELSDTPLTPAPEWLHEALSAGAGASNTSSLDFNTARKLGDNAAQRASLIPAGQWHEKTRDLVARMVREGSTDETILALAPHFTADGYSDEQTAREFAAHIRTARAKWGYVASPGPQPVAPAEAPGLRFLDVDELEDLEPIKWLIDGHVPQSAFIGLYGASGGLKSFIALEMAMAIATGRDWFGSPVTPGLVVYVAGEGQRGMAKRVIGWRRSKPDAPRPNFKLLPHAVAMPTGEGNALIEAIATLPEPPALIILDTLARMFGPGDENAQKDMNAFIAACGRLQAATGAAVLVVHHTGKDEAKGERGSSNLRAALDTSIFVRRKGRGVELINQAPHGKQKDADEFEDLKLYAAKVNFEVKGIPETTLVLMKDDNLVGQSHSENEHEADQPQRLGTVEQSIMTALERAARDGQTLGFMRITAVVSQIERRDVNKGTLLRALKNLEIKSLISKVTNSDGREVWICTL